MPVKVDINTAPHRDLYPVIEDRTLTQKIIEFRKKAHVTKTSFLRAFPECAGLVDSFLFAPESPTSPKTSLSPPTASASNRNGQQTTAATATTTTSVTTVASTTAAKTSTVTTAAKTSTATTVTKTSTVTTAAKTSTVTTGAQTTTAKSTAVTSPPTKTTAVTTFSTDTNVNITSEPRVSSREQPSTTNVGSLMEVFALKSALDEVEKSCRSQIATVRTMLLDGFEKIKSDLRQLDGDIGSQRDDINMNVRSDIVKTNKRVDELWRNTADMESSLRHELRQSNNSVFAEVRDQHQKLYTDFEEKINDFYTELANVRQKVEKADAESAAGYNVLEEKIKQLENDKPQDVQASVVDDSNRDSRFYDARNQFDQRKGADYDQCVMDDARTPRSQDARYDQQSADDQRPRAQDQRNQFDRNGGYNGRNYNRGGYGRNRGGFQNRQGFDQNRQNGAYDQNRQNGGLDGNRQNGFDTSTPRNNFRPDNTGATTFFGNEPMASKPKLPTFYGDGIWKVFIEQFNVHALINQWSDEHKKTMLLLCLRDNAADYYAMQNTGNRTFDELVKKMEKRFGKKELPETLRVQFLGLKQTAEEDLFEWAERVQKVANDAFVDLNLDDKYVTEEIVRRFCQGCYDKDLASHATSLKPKTLDEALDIMRMREFNTKAIYGSKKTPPPQVRQMTFLSSDSDSADQPQVRRFNRFDRRARSREGKSSEGTPVDKRIGKLEDGFKTLRTEVGSQLDNIIGLLKRSKSPGQAPDRSSTKERARSTSVESRSSSTGRQGTCFNCGETGHWRQDCPKPKKEKNVAFESSKKASLNSNKSQNSSPT